MNYRTKINDLIQQVCETVPTPDENNFYLEKTSKLNKLYLQTFGDDVTEEELEKIYADMKKILDE